MDRIQNISLAITGVISVTRAHPLSALIDDNAKKYIVGSPIIFLSDGSQTQVQIPIKRSTIPRVYSSNFS